MRHLLPPKVCRHRASILARITLGSTPTIFHQSSSSVLSRWKSNSKKSLILQIRLELSCDHHPTNPKLWPLLMSKCTAHRRLKYLVQKRVWRSARLLACLLCYISNSKRPLMDGLSVRFLQLVLVDSWSPV